MTRTLKVIIAGSREIPYPGNLRLVTEAVEKSGWKDQILEIVSGCARGIDDAAIKYTEKNSEFKLKKMPADWRKNSRRAGLDRNVDMANYADALIAIWDGKSKGTAHMIDTARSKGLKVFVLNQETDEDSPNKGFF